MDRLMTVLAGVSVGLFCGLILSQFHYNHFLSKQLKNEEMIRRCMGKMALIRISLNLEKCKV